MARPPYSRRFIIGTVSASVNTLSYTVPAGMVAVIRTVTATKTTAATASNVLAFIDPAGPGAGIVFWYGAMPSTAVIQSVQFEGRVVAEAGDVISVQRSISGDTMVTVTGYLLTAL